MKHLKNFQLFEAKPGDMIFKMAVNAVDPTKLVPAKTRIGKECTQEEIDNIIKLLGEGADPEKLMFDPHGFIDKFYYWDGFIIISLLHDLKPETHEVMHTKGRYEQFTKKVDKLIKANSYENIFIYYDTKLLMPAFVTNAGKIPDEQLYDCFTFAYMNSEYGFSMIDEKLLKRIVDCAKHSTERTERLKELKEKAGEEFTIYRGQTRESSQDSMSWTLSKKVADWFSKRFSSRGKILERKVKIDEVLDYLPDRNEEEILIKRK